ncbi:MAG: phage holin family protein [Lachnospiraceae bacterium]|nr:phage holin family protein [Lachnospiraceae bacterium]
MEKTLTPLNVALSVIGAFIGEKFKTIGPELFFFCYLMLADYITALIACHKEAVEHPGSTKYGWNSKKGVIGIYKKIGYFFTIFVAFGLDYVITHLIGKIWPDSSVYAIFGTLVLTWFILNELLSILENVGRMGVQLPDFLVKTISELRKSVDEKKEI